MKAIPATPSSRINRAIFSLVIVVIISVSALAAYYLAYYFAYQRSGRTTTGGVVIIATSPQNLFVGAVTDNASLYVGLIDGVVQKMDPTTGQVLESVTLPDGNSAPPLVYLNGALYVGTEKLPGAKNTAPYAVYKIDPQTMRIVANLTMTFPEANGLLFAHGGYLWAALGGCTLQRIIPDTLTVSGSVSLAAEDEMAFDGTNYWTECARTVDVLKPVAGLPAIVARSDMPSPGRPRGFFQLGPTMYCTSSENFVLYRMSVVAGTVAFTKVGTPWGSSLPTRDTFVRGGLLYTYQTRDDVPVRAQVSVFDLSFNPRTQISLPGHALVTDASQHSMLMLNGAIYFVTDSAVGFFAPLG
jgi:hypothetical protein